MGRGYLSSRGLLRLQTIRPNVSSEESPLSLRNVDTALDVLEVGDNGEGHDDQQ